MIPSVTPQPLADRVGAPNPIVPPSRLDRPEPTRFQLSHHLLPQTRTVPKDNPLPHQLTSPSPPMPADNLFQDGTCLFVSPPPSLRRRSLFPQLSTPLQPHPTGCPGARIPIIPGS